MEALQIKPIGDTGDMGIILSPSILAKLELGLGDPIYLRETEAGFMLDKQKLSIADQLVAARRIMANRKNVLHILAQ